jgi:hypothetical protein
MVISEPSGVIAPDAFRVFMPAICSGSSRKRDSAWTLT